MKRKIILKIMQGMAAIMILAGAAVLFFHVNPKAYIRYKQKTGMVRGEVNSYEPKSEPDTMALSDGITVYTDICYGEQYPNSYLDIYKNNRDQDGTYPTFLYIHGGGYAWGDKAEGDPTADAGNLSKGTEYLQRICDAGYHVVSVNYALIPEYTYPTPVLQLDAAVQFLKEKADDFGLNMSKVVFSGGSAGGHLAGQYVNIQTNPEYAKQMNLKRQFTSSEIKGVVFSCALLEPGEYDNTGDFNTNYMFSALKKVYFGNDKAVYEQADIIRNLSEQFPPAYLTDGNHATFDKQAERMNKKLEELGIYHIYNYYSREEAVLGHGYDSYLDTAYAQDNLKKVIAFLKEIQ